MKQTKIWQYFFIALVIGSSLIGCKKPDDQTDDSAFEGNGTFIICEGVFTHGDAQLDFYNKTTNTLQSNVFQTVNGAPLGDVFQSMLINGNKAYLVVNNSGKVEVVTSADLKSVGTISGLSSPRYVCFTGTTKAYVSELYSDKIAVINTGTLTLESHLNFPGWSEEMLNDNGKIWVTSANKDYTYILQNDVIVDSVNVGYGSSFIRKASDGKIWILTVGNYNPVVNSKLSRVNPTTFDVEWDYELSSNYAGKLSTNGDQSVLYFLADGKVYRKSATDNSNPSEFISLPGKSFYGLGVDPSNGDIWLGDAGDFSSAGTVYVYSSSGTQLKSFTTGTVPSGFAW